MRSIDADCVRTLGRLEESVSVVLFSSENWKLTNRIPNHGNAQKSDRAFWNPLPEHLEWLRKEIVNAIDRRFKNSLLDRFLRPRKSHYRMSILP
jgi:hypothetical protein